MAKVEALLARVRAARERLERVPLLMKRFRQSVLAKAFRGELVPTEAELAARGLNGRPCLYPDKLMRVRLSEGVVLPEYVEQFFQSPESRASITAIAKSSAGQQGISGGDLKEQLVPIPPIAEQRRIVAKIDALLAVAAKVEAEAARQLKVLARAPQAILQKAFSGELVPTEAELARAEGRSFESASELLARINRSQSAPEPSSPRRRRRPRVEQTAT